MSVVPTLVTLCALAGCDRVFDLSRPPDALVLPACVSDDFDDGLIDSATWRIVTPGNAPIVITETAGVLRFQHQPA